MQHYHPKKNDQGQLVELKLPSKASDLKTWNNACQISTVVPGGEMPLKVAGLSIEPWTDAPRHAADWEKLAATTVFDEPPFKAKPGKKPASGVVVVETDGRFWIVSPSNRYGGYTNTFPKGKRDTAEISLKANALKEAFEESGLQIKLIRFLCDVERDTTTTRYYLAQRIGGNPADMGWESQSVHLVPQGELARFLDNPKDLPILEKLSAYTPHLKVEDIIAHEVGLTSGHRILAAISTYRHRFNQWPTRILIDQGTANAIRDQVLTLLGWKMLANKVQVIPCDISTLYAEGAEGRVEYGDHTHLNDKGKERPDVWIWGISVIDAERMG